MKRIIQLLFLVLSIGFFNSVSAQQDPVYSMYNFDKMLINPAFTGSADWAVGTVKYRNQYSGFEGNPTTKTFNFHTPIFRRNVGIGIKVISDNIAIMENLNVALSYSYHMNFGGGKLSLGLETGIYSRKTQYADLILSAQYDNALPNETTQAMVPDASWGLYYQKKQFYAGFSQIHLLKSKFDENTISPSQSHLYTHLYFLSGTVFDVSKKISIEPSFLLKSVSGAPVQLDLTSMFYFKDKIGAGIQYRTGDAVVVLLKVNLADKFRIGYSYDIPTGELSSELGATHEIILSYGIKLAPPVSQKEVHPRYYF